MALLPMGNAPLQAYSGMATPATADYLVEVVSVAQLREALNFASSRSCEVLLLGEGSNTVFINHFPGLVIVNRIRGIGIQQQTADWVLLNVAAGENWHEFVQHTVKQGWFGLENLGLIPGSVGAAPMQNIGAYGVEVESCIESVTYLDRLTDIEKTLVRDQCEFGYRDSVFKHKSHASSVITSVQFRLQKAADVTVSYGALKERFAGRSPSPQEVLEAVCEIRSQKLPLPSEIPNCGSFFKNPIISHQQFIDLQANHSGIVKFDVTGGVKLAAAWLIEQGGWKDQPDQGVRVHQHQALVLTNPGRASGEIVLRLAQAIRQDVQRRYSVDLEIEPKIV